MLRSDPSNTTMLVRSFAGEIRRRFASLAKDVYTLIVTDDVFGFEPTPHLTVQSSAIRSGFLTEAGDFVPDGNFSLPVTVEYLQCQKRLEDKFTVMAQRGEWKFRTSEEKVQAFNKWLEQKVKEKILSTDAKGQPWTGKYVESAYKKGIGRAYADARGKTLKKLPGNFFRGSQAEFLRAAFNQPEKLSKAKLLATRTFEELKGITNQMSTQLNRALANGLIQGLNPKQIAKNITDNIKGISRKRSLTIARTEIIHAHAEGQLDGFKDLGVEEVGLFAEWSTAGDDKVCPQCLPLEGQVFTIEEARGLIPRHPNCRCAWIPATDKPSKNRKRALQAAVKRSVGKGKSSWSGKRLLPKKKRKK